MIVEFSDVALEDSNFFNKLEQLKRLHADVISNLNVNRYARELRDLYDEKNRGSGRTALLIKNLPEKGWFYVE